VFLYVFSKSAYSDRDQYHIYQFVRLFHHHWPIAKALFRMPEHTMVEKRRARAKSAQRTADTGWVEVAPKATAEETRAYPQLAATASIIRLEEGLYALEIDATPGFPRRLSGVALPAVQLSTPPAEPSRSIEIIGTSSGAAAWIGHEGGTVVVKAPPGGGSLWLTAFGPLEDAIRPPRVEPRRLDRPRASRGMPGSADSVADGKEVPTEIVLHVEKLGDRRFSGRGWIGNRGGKLRIEAFSIRPTEALTAGDIEIKGLGPDGRETPWVSDGKLCGTRGRHLPLTGFAVRLAPHVCDRFDVLYEGAFFESGVAGPYRNGALCIPAIADDPLEAMNVRVIRRVGQ